MAARPGKDFGIMPDPRLIDIALDGETILSPRPEVEAERQVAVTDLLSRNRFEPCRSTAQGHHGPYRARLAIADGRLSIAVADERDQPLETVLLGMTRFRRLMRDYLAIRDSFFEAAANGHPAQIEPIDMARRGIHNEAADMLKDCLEGKIAVDFDTARRLFTLIAALHPRG